MGLALIAVPAGAETPTTLTRVLVSTGGVAYFEREATVAGAGSISLTLPRDRIDDVLKSLVVYDDEGGVGAVELPGADPLQSLFQGLPFPPEALTSPVALLSSLRGAEIAVTAPSALSGRIVAVNEEQRAIDGRAESRNRVTVMTADGLASFLLEESAGLRFTDPTLESQVTKALAAMGAIGDGKLRTLTVRLTGTKPRTVRLGYVAEAPVWKATYRLTLPATDDGRGALQGWAVLENLSGEDWTNVDLTVLSGRPVTFRQNLYAPTFVERATVPVDGKAIAPPPADERAVVSAPAPVAKAESLGAARAMAMPAPVMAAPAPALAEAAPTTGTARESTAQVAFHAPAPVTLANGGSMMMPIAARPVPAEAIDLYSQTTDPRHPLAAVRLTNDTGTGLPPGVLTLYRRDASGQVAYVGDARLTALPQGEKRFLGFAIDQAVTIDRTEQATQAKFTAAIADGVLSLTTVDRRTTVYTIAGAADSARNVVIEHPRINGWTLVEPAGQVDTTADSLRLPVSVAAGGSATLTVALERPRSERLALLDLPDARVTAFAEQGALPQAVRDAFVRIAQLRAAVADAERRRAAADADHAALAEEEERARANLTAAPKNSDLAKRSIDRINDLDRRLERLTGDLAAARRDADSAQSAVVAFIRGLKL